MPTAENEKPTSSFPPRPWARRSKWTSFLGSFSLFLSFMCYLSPCAIIPGLIAIIMGKRALGRMVEGEATVRDFANMRRGIKRGAWGMAIGGVACLGIWFLGQIMIGVEDKKSSIICINNEKQICTALQLYADDNDGYLPPATNWTENAVQYSKNISSFYCHSHWLRTHKKHENTSVIIMARNSLGVETRVRDYGLNAALAGKRLSDLANPSEVVLIYETSQLAVSPSGSAVNVTRPGLHNKGNYYRFADGHVKWIEDGEAASFVPQWKKAAVGHQPSAVGH
jgi:hypothetical protein